MDSGGLRQTRRLGRERKRTTTTPRGFARCWCDEKRRARGPDGRFKRGHRARLAGGTGGGATCQFQGSELEHRRARKRPSLSADRRSAREHPSPRTLKPSLSPRARGTKARPHPCPSRRSRRCSQPQASDARLSTWLPASCPAEPGATGEGRAPALLAAR